MDKDTNKTDGIPEGVKNKLNWKWVDARTLHKELGVMEYFTSWIEKRINRYGLVEGKDYEIYFKPSIYRGAAPRQFLLSPETAEKLKHAHYRHICVNNNQISTFTFESRKLNVFQYNGELWFFGVDVCDLIKTARHAFPNRTGEKGR